MIGNAKWYLGGSGTFNDVTASMFYTRERGTEVYSYSKRSTSWTGKVGLMYPSDYGYATSGGTKKNRASCLEEALYYWNNSSVSSVSDCKNNDWVYKPNLNYQQWTITSLSLYDNEVVNVNTSGFVASDSSMFVSSVRPVVHLKSTIKVISGSGTKDSPYILSGN